MREIKFRAWGKENKEIYEPDLIYDGKSAELNKSPDLQDVDSNNDVLMQYTGLKDKNGKEIFEGDICRLDDNEPEDGEIGWIDDGWYFRNYCSNEALGALYPRLKIIGNIYENKDLLNKNK